MKADRPSLFLALSSQVLFGVLLPATSWNVAARSALSLAALALGLALLGARRGGSVNGSGGTGPRAGGLEGGAESGGDPRIGSRRGDAADCGLGGDADRPRAGAEFPRLPMGCFLCFGSMTALGLAFPGDLFPYTGLFFACGLAAASLIGAVLPALGRSRRPLARLDLSLGLGYAAAAGLHLAFFPRPAYLYFGVGLLLLVSALDIGSGVFRSVRAGRRSLGRARLVLAAALLFSLSRGAGEAAAQAADSPAAALRPAPVTAPGNRTEEEIFAAIFGELPAAASVSESADDILRVAAIRVERPDCFTEAYVRAFARGLEIGRRLRRGELEAILRTVAERLEFSQRFYRAGVSYVALPAAGPCAGAAADAESGAAAEPAAAAASEAMAGAAVAAAAETEAAGAPEAIEVAVTIAVSDGFWWDFNFEPFDLMIAHRNLFRAGKELAVVAGLNTQAVRYRDPAVDEGVLYWSAAAGHRVEEDEHAAGEGYLYESVSGEGEVGRAFGDDLRLAITVGYAAYRAPAGYFLYPDYDPPAPRALERLGMSGADAYAGIATVAARASAGAYSFKRRGGLRARAEGSLAALAPEGDLAGTGLKASASLDLRLDFARPDAARSISAARRAGEARDEGRRLYLAYHGTVERFPRSLEGSAIPEPLWAGVDEGRYRTGLVSGEFASLSRVSLGLDPLAAAGLGFTRLSLIPELYYECTAVRFGPWDDAPAWGHNVGVLIKGAFSAPVNRVFSVGLACGLPGPAAGDGASDDRGGGWALFLEIE